MKKSTTAPIGPEFQAQMNDLAAFLDGYFNGNARGKDKKVGFILLTYNFGQQDEGRINYIGNGPRDDVRASLTELLARWEGRYNEGGRA